MALGDVALLGLAGLAAWLMTRLRAVRRYSEYLFPLIGPLWRWELREQARQRLWWIRSIHVWLLLGLLIGATVGESGFGRNLTPERRALLTTNFADAFLTVQLLIAFLLTPAIVARAVLRDQERGTWDLLRTAPLAASELAAGKLAAGLGSVGSVLLSGWPVLLLVALIGQVDRNRLLLVLLVVLMTMLSSGTVALWRSVRGGSLLIVLLWSYAVPLFMLILGFLAPLASTFTVGRAILNGELFFAAGGVTVAIHLGITIAAWVATIRGIRHEPRSESPEAPRPENRSSDSPDVYRQTLVPELGDGNPWLWKERHFSGRNDWDDVLLGFGALGLLALAVGMGGWFTVGVAATLSGLPPQDWLLPPARVLLMGATVWACGQGGLYAVTALARERQRQTLSCLLVLPWERRTLLNAKRRIAWERVQLLLGLVGVAWLACVWAVGFGWSVGLALVIVGLWVLASLECGLWLSACSATAPMATVRALVIVGFVGIVPIVVEPALRQTAWMAWEWDVAPVWMLYRLASGGEFGKETLLVFALLLGAIYSCNRALAKRFSEGCESPGV